MRTVDKPDDMLAEAIRLEELSRIEAKAGNFTGCAYFACESNWCLNYAAELERN